MNHEKLEWRNKNIFTYKDYEYGTHASINISLSKSINVENKNLSNTTLLVSINSSGMHRNVPLQYNKLYNLISRLKGFVKDWKEIIINCGKSNIKIKEVNSDPRLISLFIINNENDFGNIVFDIPTFMSLCKILSSIVDNYIEIDGSFNSEIQNSIMFNVIDSRIKNLENCMSLLKSKFFNELEIKNPVDINDSMSSDTLDTFNQMNELDDFIGGNNLDKIMIDDIVKMDRDYKIEKDLKDKNIVNTKNINKIKSSFINDVLKCDINNFENLIISICHENNPIKKFIDIIKLSLNINNDEFEFLPGISESDFKSSLYVGKLMFDIQMKRYLEFFVKITNNVSVIKYKPSKIYGESLDLAYDLLLIMGYIRLSKEKLELKEDDCQINKSITYLATRCFLDLFYFSFLNELYPDTVKTCILDRFETYKENNFFKSFEDVLLKYNLDLITKNDISKFIDSVGNKVLNNNLYIDVVHKELYEAGNVKLPPNNKLTEQIINNAIKLEVDIKVWNLDPEKCIEGQDKELINYFLAKYPKKERIVNNESPLLRAVKYYDNEISDEIKSGFYDYINEISKDNLDFDYNKFNIRKFGENIIRAIYEWNCSDKTYSFKDLFLKIENSESKKDLLNKIYKTEDVEVKSDNIDDILSSIGNVNNKSENSNNINDDWLSEISL